MTEVTCLQQLTLVSLYSQEGGSVTLTATGNDPENGSLTYAWDLDNNGSFETPGQSVTFSAVGLNAPSSHTIAVRVTDNVASRQPTRRL